MIRKWLIFSILLSLCHFARTQDQVAYIRSYQDIAIAEMIRTGIPASIKLAQAILESNCGKSDLACKANNHFGIKCGNNWNGKSYHREDDDYENGKLIKSCFREFNSAHEAYVAHSDFLADPAKAGRYGSLFQLNITDYKGWAKGLSRAGYATDPRYADRLIEIIERYELYRFDNEYESGPLAAAPSVSTGNRLVRQYNEVKYAMADKGDTPAILARRYDVKVDQLLRYNDDLFSAGQTLEEGARVYLQPKKSKYLGKQTYHTIQPGEDMVMISQRYGIKLDALLKRNGIAKNQVPLPKQKIVLKGKQKKDLRTADPYLIPDELPQESKLEKPSYEQKSIQAVDSDLIVSAESGIKSSIQDVSTTEKESTIHTVSKGETLYGVARNYGLSVDELKKKNNLSADTIFVGQKLIWQ